MLRQGRRVVFELDEDGRAVNVRSGAEPDLGLPLDVYLSSAVDRDQNVGRVHISHWAAGPRST
jgi:hypothetical protein